MSATLLFCGLLLAQNPYAEHQVAVLLSGFEYLPTRAQLLDGRNEADVRDALAALALDTDRPLFVRARAADWLGRFRADQTAAVVAELLDRGDDVHPMLRRAAIRSAGLFVRSPFDFRVRLAELADHQDFHLRETARAALEQQMRRTK